MTRIESPTPMGDREALKREIRNEITAEGRRRHVRGCFGCLIGLIVVLGVPLLYLSIQLAKAGFVSPPLLGGMYHDVAPVREVQPLAGSNADMVVRTAMQRMRPDPALQQFSLFFDEADLTTLLRDGVTMAPPDTLPFPIRRAQFAIEKDYLELFVVTVKDGRDVTLRFRFVPTVHNGKVDIDVVEAVSGALTIPNKMVTLLFDAMFAPAIANVQTQMKSVGQLNSIALKDKQMTFTFYSPR